MNVSFLSLLYPSTVIFPPLLIRRREILVISCLTRLHGSLVPPFSDGICSRYCPFHGRCELGNQIPGSVRSTALTKHYSGLDTISCGDHGCWMPGRSALLLLALDMALFFLGNLFNFCPLSFWSSSLSGLPRRWLLLLAVPLQHILDLRSPTKCAEMGGVLIPLCSYWSTDKGSCQKVPILWTGDNILKYKSWGKEIL